MENRNIIIILVVVIIVLAVVAGAMFLQSTNSKEATKIKITSDKSQYEGGKLTLQLTDLNKTAISKENVNVTATNKNGKVVVNKTVKTNAKGKASLDLGLKKGKYVVNVTYGGNENYTGNNTTQNLAIKEVVTEVVDESSYSISSYNPSKQNALIAKAEAAGIGYDVSDDGEVFIDEAAYAEYSARTGEDWF